MKTSAHTYPGSSSRNCRPTVTTCTSTAVGPPTAHPRLPTNSLGDRPTLSCPIAVPSSAGPLGRNMKSMTNQPCSSTRAVRTARRVRRCHWCTPLGRRRRAPRGRCPAGPEQLPIFPGCAGNSCRAPLAEAVLRQRFVDDSEILVGSADTQPARGRLMLKHTREIAYYLGTTDAHAHRSRKVTVDLL